MIHYRKENMDNTFKIIIVVWLFTLTLLLNQTTKQITSFAQTELDAWKTQEGFNNSVINVEQGVTNVLKTLVKEKSL